MKGNCVITYGILLLLIVLLIPTFYLLLPFITPVQHFAPAQYNDGNDTKDLVRTEPANFLDFDRTKLASVENSMVRTDSIPINEQSSHYPVEERINRCMKATHLEEFLSQAQLNAKYFYNEHRKVIPLKALSDYSSHCWNVSFFSQWSKLQHNGYFGNMRFKIEELLSDKLFKSRLTGTFPAMKFKSDLVCLPNLFLAGFPKCGTSFLYCLINKLLHGTTCMQYLKEPHFWVRANAVKDVHVPIVDHLGEYILNFLPGFAKRSNAMLIDGTPNMMFNWPRFRQSEHNFTNYCLIPSILPNLLPDSKYIVIMRNPIDLLYSAFWYSCTRIVEQLPMEVQLKGPHLFHDRIKTNITIFNNCMMESSVPLINHTCSMATKDSYSACITKRLHLLDKCIHDITFNLFSPELPHCGRSRIAMGVFFVHVRKWLSVVAKDRFFFLTLEDIAKNTTQGMLDVLKYLGLKTTNNYKISAELAKDSCGTNSQVRVNYKRDHRLQMRADTRALLEIFYHPFNLLLSELLNRTTLWSGE